MTFDWGAAWSVMGVVAVGAAIVFATIFVAMWMDDKWGVSPAVPVATLLLIALFIVAGLAGGGVS